MGIVISQVSKQFNNHVILDNISFTIHHGEILYLAGLNGSGKTTLIRGMLDLIQMDNGTISFDDHSYHEKKDQIAVLFDEPFFYNALSAYDNAELLSGVKIVQNDFQRELFESLRINQKFLKQTAKGLSLGQRHKLGLAIALMRNPDFLMLDEPFIGLDFITLELFANILTTFKANGCSMLITGQDYNNISEISDSLAILSGTKIQYHQDIKQIDNIKDFVLNSLRAGAAYE